MFNNIKTSNSGSAWCFTGVVLVLVANTSLAMEKGNNESREVTTRAQFVDDTTVRLPEGYRTWTHIGAFLKAPGSPTILDGSPIEGAQFFNTYVEPSALETFKATGEWPDGTQFVKEFSASSLEDESCDKETGLCSTPHGMGIFESYAFGIGYMIKDTARFPEEAGNWGYFGFGPAVDEPYPATAQLRPVEDCAACHIAHRADRDYVFSDLHLGLQ